ncbi:winged helix-turn-helix transcriptional regulator [Thermosulfuriphilus sp.]
MVVIQEVFRNLGTKSKWLVLSVIYREPGLCGREIARRTGLSWAPVREALEGLEEMGLIEKKTRGRSYHYYPNRQHLLYPALKQFFGELETCVAQIFKELNLAFRRQEALVLSVVLSPREALVIFEAPQEDQIGELRETLQAFWQKKGLGALAVSLVPVDQVAQNLSRIKQAEVILGIDPEALARKASISRKLSFFDF